MFEQRLGNPFRFADQLCRVNRCDLSQERVLGSLRRRHCLGRVVEQTIVTVEIDRREVGLLRFTVERPGVVAVRDVVHGISWRRLGGCYFVHRNFCWWGVRLASGKTQGSKGHY